MSKPWAKYQIGFIRSRKFAVLSAEAICLWLEGKDYADEQLTDGVLPMAIVKRFRFYSRPAIVALTTSAGQQNGDGSEVLAPLWEVQTGGWKMHDYLGHNESRATVRHRIEVTEAAKIAEKTANRERMARWRAAKAAKQAAAAVPPVTPVVTPHVTVSVTPLVTPLSRSITTATATATATEDHKISLSERSVCARTRARAARDRHPLAVTDGSLPRDHLHHGWCSPNYSHCVPTAVHTKLLNLLAPKYDGDRTQAGDALLAWYPVVCKSLPDGFIMDGDEFKFWTRRFTATFASADPAADPLRKPLLATTLEEDVAGVRALLRRREAVTK